MSPSDFNMVLEGAQWRRSVEGWNSKSSFYSTNVEPPVGKRDPTCPTEAATQVHREWEKKGVEHKGSESESGGTDLQVKD